MGIDEQGGKFFGVNVVMRRPNVGETYAAIRVGQFVLIAAGPIVQLREDEAGWINDKSKAGGAFPAGIIERIL
jgi:hypothetical protein